MRADLIPLAGKPTTPEHRAKHCAGSDYKCAHCAYGFIGTYCVTPSGNTRHTKTNDATGYPLRLAECEEVEDG